MMLSSTLSVLIICIVSAFAQNECYYAAGKRAGSAIIPCGTTGTISGCCQIGDLCLSDSACWNPTYNVTYLYGCTDPNYEDSTCPWKCGSDFDDAPYVGLDYCFNTTQNEWSCTHPPSNSDSIQPIPAQQCYSDSIVAFAGPSSLQPILSLPTAIGGSTEWFSQVNPTSYLLDPKYTPTTTSIQITASVPTTVELISISTATGSETTASQGQTTATSSATAAIGADKSGLSTGAKIGIGVGVAGGALGLIALVGATILFLRRRHSNDPVSPILEKAERQHPATSADVKASLLGPPKELPGSEADIHGQMRYGAGQGDGSTASGRESPAPEYRSFEHAPQKQATQDEFHEME